MNGRQTDLNLILPEPVGLTISAQEIQGTEEEIKQYHEEAISQIKDVGSPPGQIPRVLHQINGI